MTLIHTEKFVSLDQLPQMLFGQLVKLFVADGGDSYQSDLYHDAVSIHTHLTPGYILANTADGRELVLWWRVRDRGCGTDLSFADDTPGPSYGQPTAWWSASLRQQSGHYYKIVITADKRNERDLMVQYVKLTKDE